MNKNTSLLMQALRVISIFMNEKELRINILYLKFKMKKDAKQNRDILFYISISCKRALIRTLVYKIPEIALPPLH